MKIDQDVCERLFDSLEKITITLNTSKMGRARVFGTHRAMSLGIVKNRITKKYVTSRLTHKYPEIFEMLTDISTKYFPEYGFNSIHVNKNVVCTPHLDINNIGPSIIFSIGNYEGCNLMITQNGITTEINTREHAVLFEGNKHIHYNTPLLSGTKYSFVFFKTQPE